MQRFIGALIGFALVALVLGFTGIAHPWGGLARSLFFLYAAVLAACCGVALLTGGARQSGGGSASQKRSR